MIRTRHIMIFLAALGLAACSTTTFVSTWKTAGAHQIDPTGKAVVALFVTRDEAKRRMGEDLLATDLTRRGARGIASYTIVPNDPRGNVEAVREKLKAAGADAVVVMRVMGKEQKVWYTPGASYSVPVYYNQFGSYWTYGWQTVYEPGYLQNDTIVSVETLVYSLQQDKLLWAAISRTINPSNLDRLLTEVANAAAKEMASQGLLSPSR